ncbi:uncharacterized protein [Ptychodera flava]|uniref:uncharacterized protein n=1 Tax=Ptychodera flava TaxID=63121 RepID=UPI00396A504C
MAMASVPLVLTSIDKVLSTLSKGLKSEEWKSMCKSLNEFGEVLHGLVAASEQSRVVRTKAYDAVFEIKNSLQDILDESIIHRHSHEKCKDILKRLKESIQFEQMEIGEFLEKNTLSPYEQLFKEEEIQYAGELLEGYDEILKSAKSRMKIGSFSRFKKSIERAKISQDYIENKLASDLVSLEETFTEATRYIGEKLKTFIKHLSPVIKELARVIEDEETRITIITGVAIATVAVLGIALVGTGAGCLFCGIPGLIAIYSGGALACKPIAATLIGATAIAGLGVVTGVGGYGIHKVRKDMKDDLDQLKHTEQLVRGWQEALREQFLQWRSLVTAFKELFLDLKKHQERYKDQQREIDEKFERTDDILNDALHQTNEFERMVKALRDKKITNINF